MTIRARLAELERRTLKVWLLNKEDEQMVKIGTRWVRPECVAWVHDVDVDKCHVTLTTLEETGDAAISESFRVEGESAESVSERVSAALFRAKDRR